jgi:Cytidylyltransferase-like
MMGLAKFLVETILGEAAEMDKVVVVYSGRFQPFHKGHYATYENLIRKFGKDSVYIGTSNVTDSKKSPFNFNEKKAIMTKMFGIPSSKIVNVKNPYAPQEILNDFDSDTTGFITVVGEKDSSRLSGKYFTPYKGKVEVGYLDKGYVYASPAQPNAISGTDVRYWLSAGSEEERKKNFTKAYPKFDDQIFKLITLKLKKLKECINEEITLNVKIGDTLLMGKFKNKKVVVKSIGEDEWGMPTINGKKAVTFRIPKKEQLKETASNSGFAGQDEPDTSFVADGQPRILNKAKPEAWYKQGGYTQMDTPKADAMRGRGKSKDTETQFRKAVYKLKNVTQSTLNPADDPFKVEDWQDAYRENPNEKPKRFWELPDNQKDTIISKEDINEIMDEFEENIMSEMGLGGGAGVGLSLPGGYINGAPNPKDVKKLKSKLDGDGSEEYQPIDEKVVDDIIICDNCNWQWEMKDGGDAMYLCHKCGHDNHPKLAEGLKDLEKELVSLYNKAFKMMPKSPAQMKVRAEIDKLKNQIDKLKKENTNEMAKADMDAVEKYADQQLAPSDVELGKETDHFFQRLNDPRNGKEISPAELTGFFKRLAKNKKKFLEFVKQYKEFVVKDRRTDINIPFVVMANKLIAKTIMRKGDFKSITPIYVSEQILTEGGAYGHMNHPFDIEMNLTFADLKSIVTKALNGDLELTREKTDGQALAVSWVNGRLVAARNKSHLKSKGAGAMTIGQVAEKFGGRGGLTDAYNFAMQDLSKAIAALSEPQRLKIFKDGACFMNLEVIYPTSVNVIPYNQPLLVFHGTFEYDDAGTIVGENQQAASILGGMIKQVNAHVQSKYTIQGPPMTKLPKSEQLAKLQGKYLGMISKLQSEFGLSDNDGVGEYHQAWWSKFVEKGGKKLDAQEKIGLVKRWAFNDKSFRIATIQDPKLRAWAEQIDKQDQQKISKQNLMRFEEIFLGVGADVLSFMESVLTANPDSAKRQMVARLQSTIAQVKASGDPKKVEKLKLELERLNSLGGFDKIVPNEGIVFVYGGNTYKLTGAFAPLNQILGIFFDS